MLRIQNLHASIDGYTILNGIDLNVNKGEMHILMGPNGSGKSSLASVRVHYPMCLQDIQNMKSTMGK